MSSHTANHPRMPPLGASYHVDLPLAAWAIVALLLLAPYWLGPIRIKGKQRRSPVPHPMTLATDPSAIPARLIPFVAEAQRVLPALGFTNFAVIREMAGVVVLAESESGTVATGIAIPKADGTVHSLIGFTTQLRGGGKVRTSNSPLPSILPAPQGESRARYPEVRDTARLYRIHTQRVARMVATSARVERLTVADPIAYQQHEEAAGIAHALGSGYWRRSGDQLVLTWKGAFFSAWRMLQPWRWLVLRRDDRLLREISTARA